MVGFTHKKEANPSGSSHKRDQNRGECAALEGIKKKKVQKHLPVGIAHSRVGITHNKVGIAHSKKGITHSRVGITHNKVGITHSKP